LGIDSTKDLNEEEIINQEKERKKITNYLEDITLRIEEIHRTSELEKMMKEVIAREKLKGNKQGDVDTNKGSQVSLFTWLAANSIEIPTQLKTSSSSSSSSSSSESQFATPLASIAQQKPNILVPRKKTQPK
ncbi:MAG: hypothetical protein EZS28_054318, partial [Streblomastix strix]